VGPLVIWCLHGFLGRPSDWAFLPFEHRAPDLFDHPEPSLPLQAARLNAITHDGDVLIGYSMGGRLALHALLAADRPQYAAAVIVSTGVGISDADQRADRLRRDALWAQRFETDPWSEVVRDWNAQPVFGGHEVERSEGDFDRHALGAVMRGWSPAAHPDLGSRIADLDVPILWIAGESDAPYAAIAERAAASNARITATIVQGAGHRVPWEASDEFVALVSSFLGDCGVRLP
jgi:2-succinyl-6-hydroxy-2,4-cyclohexadiene-1-carboxylate synthase